MSSKGPVSHPPLNSVPSRLDPYLHTTIAHSRHATACVILVFPSLVIRSTWLIVARRPPGFARLDGRMRPSLRILFYRLQPQLLHHHLQVLPSLALLPRIAQQERRMVGDRELASIPVRIVATHARRSEVVKASAQLHHRSIHRQQRLRRHRSQRDDYLRFNHRDLPHQKRRASGALVALRRAITRGAALHDVRDVHLLALDPHRFDHVVEQLPGASHEGLALFVFIGARPLAHKHQLGVWIPYADYDLLPSLLMEHAARAVAQVFADDLQRLYRIAHTLLGLQRDHLKNILFNHHRHRDRYGLPWTHLFSRPWIYRDSNF